MIFYLHLRTFYFYEVRLRHILCLPFLHPYFHYTLSLNFQKIWIDNQMIKMDNDLLELLVHLHDMHRYGTVASIFYSNQPSAYLLKKQWLKFLFHHPFYQMLLKIFSKDKKHKQQSRLLDPEARRLCGRKTFPNYFLKGIRFLIRKSFSIQWYKGLKIPIKIFACLYPEKFRQSICFLSLKAQLS